MLNAIISNKSNLILIILILLYFFMIFQYVNEPKVYNTHYNFILTM